MKIHDSKCEAKNEIENLEPGRYSRLFNFPSTLYIWLYGTSK